MCFVFSPCLAAGLERQREAQMAAAAAADGVGADGAAVVAVVESSLLGRLTLG